MRIILASESPFRKRTFDILGLDIETMPSHFDETSIRNDDPLALAKELAEAKALEIGKSEEAIIVAADLFVVFNNKIYEKPKDEGETFKFLSDFSGNKLDIISGVAVYNSKTKEMSSAVGKYTVKFRELKDYEIRDYISRYPTLKCSAGFESDALIRFADIISGDYPFQTGMPIKELIQLLRKNGVKV